MDTWPGKSAPGPTLGQQVSNGRVGWQQGAAIQHVVRVVVAGRAHVGWEGGVGPGGGGGRA